MLRRGVPNLKTEKGEHYGDILEGLFNSRILELSPLTADRETIEWFLAEFAKAINPTDEAGQQGMIAMMDTPRRVVLELNPIKRISYDGMKLGMAIASEGITN